MPRRRRAYPTDLTDAQWTMIVELVPDAKPGGRPRRAKSRELVNAILYALRAGHAWRLLPHDFPPWQTVYYYLRRWQAEGVWQRIHHAVLTADRERAAARPVPPRRSSTANRCAPLTKKGLERLRRGQESRRAQAAHLTDTDGRVLAVQMHSASVQDRD